MGSFQFVHLAALCGFVAQSLAQSPTNWVVRAPLPSIGELGEITFYDGRFLLADASGGMLTSSNGRNWTPRIAGPPPPLKIIYAEGTYVAITQEDILHTIYSSTDGLTWTPRWQTLELRDLLYANGLFVAVAQQSILTSTNGANWSEPGTFWGWRLEEAAFGNGVYVVVGSHLDPIGNVPLVLRSTNGIDWTRHTPPGGPLFTVTYGNGLFVANGITSRDGMEWTAHPSMPGYHELGFGNGYFVSSSEDRIYYSTNGSDWSAGCLHCDGSSDGSYFYADSIAFGNGQFITANKQGSMYISSDARNWSVFRSGAHLNGIAYGAGRFVAVGDDSTVWSSFDGREWTYAFARGKGVLAAWELFGVAFGNGLFVAVGGLGPKIATSPDGLTWTGQHEQGEFLFERLYGVAFGNGMWVAAGERLVGPGATFGARILVSSDGTNWSYATFPGDFNGFLGAGYANGTFVVVGTQGAILTSPDGVNWTTRVSGTSQTLRAVVFNAGRFIVGGDTGVTAISTNGTNWTVSAPTSFSIRGLGAGTGMIAVGNAQNDGALHYSADGVGWPGDRRFAPEILNGIASGNGSWVAVGNDGLIFQGGHNEVRLSNPIFRNGALEVTIQTEVPLSSFTIQASTNFTEWVPVRSVSSPPQTFLYRDTTVNAPRMRAYRVIAP